MIKKNINNLIFLIIFFLMGINNTNAVIGSGLGLDLYKEIDEGIDEISNKNMKYELETSKKDFSKCINTDAISLKNMRETSLGSNEALFEIISNECFDNKEISLGEYTKVRDEVTNFYNESKRVSDKKAKTIFEISRIGLYSDGSIENSSYDLIDDIDRINQIIFTKEIEYKGEEIVDEDDNFERFLKGEPLNGIPNKGTGATNNFSGATLSGFSVPLPEFKNQIINGVSCNVHDNNSYLDPLLFEKTTNPNQALNDKGTYSGSGGVNNNGSNYESVNDVSRFPCNKFFCIKIDFIMYTHNVLGGGKSFSIEYVVNKSNEHIKKFAGSFLGLADMTNNQFQCGICEYLQLGDMFHVGFQVEKLSPPILNLEKIDREKKNEFAVKNMMETEFANMGLEYKRKNDIALFVKEEWDRKSILDSSELTIKEAGVKNSDFKKIFKEKEKKSQLFSDSIDKKNQSEDMKDFYHHFEELEKYGANLLDNSVKMSAEINNMNKIPVKK